MPWLRVIISMSVLLVAQSVAAQGAGPNEGEQLILPRSPTWSRVIYQDNKNQEVARYVLKGQTDKDWTEMLTVQVSPGSNITINDLGARVFAGAGDCIINTNRGPQTETVNGFRSALYRSACSSPKLPEGVTKRPVWLKDHQISTTKAIWTVNNTYIITRVWHGDKITPDHPDQSKGSWARFFKGVEVCEPDNIKRACQAWGVLSRRDARHRPPVMGGPKACDVLDQLMVRSAKTNDLPYTRHFTIHIGTAPFFSSAKGQDLAVAILNATRKSNTIAVEFGIFKNSRHGREADQKTARTATLALRQFLADNGIEDGRMNIGLNSGCMPR